MHLPIGYLSCTTETCYTITLSTKLLHLKTRTPFHFDLRFLAQRAITLKELLQDPAVGSTIFKYHTQTLQILGDYPLGSNVGILIRPEDIIISKDLVKTSARNFLRIKIVNVTKPIGATGMIRVHMLLEEKLRLVAKITDEARLELGIEDGDMVYAIFKASSPQVVREGNSH